MVESRSLNRPLWITFYDICNQVRDETVSRLLNVRDRILSGVSGAPSDLECGFGSTPSCSLGGSGLDNSDGQVSEMHPGNYVFFDAQQWKVL